MNNFNIGRQSFTNLFWETIFINGTPICNLVENQLSSKHKEIESLRKLAAYNTGSMSLASSLSLSLITYYFNPKIIVEIGTFIGRSTYSIALGSSLTQSQLEKIHTCDFSNDIPLNFDPVLDMVQQYPKTSSTEMLKQLQNRGIKPDFYFIDGRLTDEDLLLMESIDARSSIILMDDFEGTDKGVINSLKVTDHFKNNFMLSYSPPQYLLDKIGINDRSSLAVLVPASKISYVKQMF